MRKLVLGLVGIVIATILWVPSVSAEALPCIPDLDESSCTEIILPPCDCIQDDGDGVPTPVEDASVLENGDPVPDDDNNYDGVIDSTQSQVATAPNPNDQEAPNSYVTLEVLPKQEADPEKETPEIPSNWNIILFNPVEPENFAAPVPTDRTFPVGLFDLVLHNPYLDNYNICERYELECDGSPADLDAERTVTVRLLFDRVLDHSNWTVEQFNDVLGQYSDYSEHAVVEDVYVGFWRTAITWTLKDGDFGDQDATENGYIVDGYGEYGYIYDPIGPSVPNSRASSSTTPPVVTVASAINPTNLSQQAPELANTGESILTAFAAGILLIATFVVIFLGSRNTQNELA